MAVASEQEMKAKAQEARAKVIEAEAEVPKAMAEALNEGKITNKVAWDALKAASQKPSKDEYFVSEYCILVHNAGDLYSRPSGYRKGVRDKTWNEAKASSPDGVVRDPKTGRPIDFNEPWDMGHKPGYEFRKHKISAKQRGISRKQFLDEHNDYTHYRPELPSSNRSHTCEDL